jgi:hypothetical protein
MDHCALLFFGANEIGSSKKKKKTTHALTSKTLFYIHIKTLNLVKNVL